MSEVLNKIKAELDAFQVKKAELLESLRKEFPELFKPLMSQLKNIETIGWTQYTPYFNDGEECTFSAHTDDLMVDDEYEYERDDLKSYVYGKLVTEEDKQTNDKLAKLSGRDWYEKKQIGEEGLVPNPDFNKEDGEIFIQIKSLLQEIPEEFLKDLFGDHSKITINKDGTISVDEYEHD